MILDKLERASLYSNMHPRLREAFEQLRRTDLATLPLGRNTIKPYLHVDVVKGENVGREKTKVEVHKRYIDIHMPLSGLDCIGWLDLPRCRNFLAAYPDKDAELFGEICESWNDVPLGYFALYFTGEGHAPMGATGPLHKVVVKVALED